MMKKFFITLFCLFAVTAAVAETVYKKVNPDGSVEFTDTGSKDSEEVKIREPVTFKPPSLPKLDLPVKKLSPTVSYSLTITKPAEDEVLINLPEVTVSVSLQPALLSGIGHKLRFELAGESKVTSSSSVSFSNVPRGAHSIIVSVVDSNGEVVGPIVSRNFHMKQFFKKPAKKP